MMGATTQVMFRRLADVAPRQYVATQYDSGKGSAEPQQWDDATVLAWFRWHLTRGRITDMSITITGAER